MCTYRVIKKVIKITDLKFFGFRNQNVIFGKINIVKKNSFELRVGLVNQELFGNIPIDDTLIYVKY